MALICKSGGKECEGCGECFGVREAESLESCAICGLAQKGNEIFFHRYFYILCRGCYESVTLQREEENALKAKKGKRINGENRIYRY